MNMKKVYILLGLVSVAILISVIMQQTIKEEIQTEDYSTIEFAGLMKNPDTYNNKNICIIATFTSGREERSLEHIIWLSEYDSDFINGEKVLACGIFRVKPEGELGFGHLARYSYNLEINKTISKLLE